MININELIKEAYKSKNTIVLNAYKNLKSEFQKVKTAKDYKGEWTEELELRTIAKYGRQLDAAIAEFGGPQTPLGQEYSNELEVVRKLLPKPVDALEMFKTFSDWCVENNFCSEIEEFIVMPEGTKSSGRTLQVPKKIMGNAIKYLKSKFPTADGKVISDIVKSNIV